MQLKRVLHAGTNDAADVAASKAAGKLTWLPKPQTIADGLQVCPHTVARVANGIQSTWQAA